MLLGKLRPDDAISLTTFENKSYIIYPMTLVKDINKEEFLDKLKQLKTLGGTTIITGFTEAAN